MAKIIKGDQVVVIAGGNGNKPARNMKKGVTGTVVSVKGDRVLVEGVNLVKKHQKPNQMTGVEGGIIEKEAAIHISNLALLNPTTQKADRAGYQVKDGNKTRVYKSSGEPVATASK